MCCNFWSNSCDFKDIQTRKKIDYGIKGGRLYYLDLTKKIQRNLVKY